MKIALLLSLVLVCTAHLFAQVDPVDGNKLAIAGYDPVTYFNATGPQKGSPANAYVYGDVVYYFISAENKDLFEANPSQYLPQYDGYCALGISYGTKISIDPETYKVTNGKLYLFYNGKSGSRKVNSLDTWNKDEDRLLKKANELWPKVSSTKYRKS